MLTEGMYIADRYEVLGKIGTGGMSDVYRAMDHILGRRVAIKVLKADFAEDVNFVTKFRSEAQAAASLEHPNIVNIYDVGSENGMHYIVMEYVEGITLKGYIEKKRVLTYKEAVSIAIQVGKGIEAAHNKHIVHRDIKPQNILISTDGKVKVTDFGIARAVNNNTIHTDVMGSVHYSSPEQARNGYVDGKSDIYSLGIVMYEMVTGRVPFDGDTTVAVAIKHLQEELPEPRIFAPELPVSLEGVIKKCTQKNPDRRYEDMAALIADLKRVLESPNEDFVVLDAAGNARTRVIQADEVETIRKEAAMTGYGGRKAQEPEYEEEDEYEEEEEEEDEEDEDGFLNPKMEKAVTILGIVAAVIIVVIIIVIVMNWVGVFKFGGGDTDKDKDNQIEENLGDQEEEEKFLMIDIRGMTKEEALEELRKQEIPVGLKEAGYVSSDEYEKDQIVEQSVKEGQEVEKNSTVEITICSGPGEFSAPSVLGKTDDEARQIIEDMELKALRGDFAYSDTVEEGKVISQTPEAGTSVKKGDTITYVISKGQEELRVPDVYNHPEAEARSILEAAGFAVTNVDSEYSDTIPAGNVIRQSVEAGEYRTRGTVISLVVSLGKQTVYYTYDKTYPVPEEGAVFVKAVLTMAESDEETVFENITPNADGSIRLVKNNIANFDRGSLVIYWKHADKEETDAEGNIIKTPGEEFTQGPLNVSFDRQ